MDNDDDIFKFVRSLYDQTKEKETQIKQSKNVKKLANNIKNIKPQQATEIATKIENIKHNETIQNNADNATAFFTAAGSILWFITDNKKCFDIEDDNILKFLIYISFSTSVISGIVSSIYKFRTIMYNKTNKSNLGKLFIITLFTLTKMLFYILWALNIKYNGTDDEDKCMEEFKIILWIFITCVFIYSISSFFIVKDSTSNSISQLFA